MLRLARVVRTSAIAAAVGTLVLGAGASVASAAADSIAVSITPTPQAASLPLDIVVSGVESSQFDEALVTYKPAGGACAATPAADSGTAVTVNANASGDPNQFGEGPWAYTSDHVVPGSGLAPEENVASGLPVGSYLVCAWLVERLAGAVVAATETTFTVAPAEGSITVLGPPSTVYTDSQLVWKVNWTVNSPAWIAADAVGRATYVCPAGPNDITKAEYATGRYFALSPTEPGGHATDIGPGSTQQATSTGTSYLDMTSFVVQFSAGTIYDQGPYVECVWLTTNNGGADVLYGPVTRHFTITKAWEDAECRSTYKAWLKHHPRASGSQRRAEGAMLQRLHSCRRSTV